MAALGSIGSDQIPVPKDPRTSRNETLGSAVLKQHQNDDRAEDEVNMANIILLLFAVYLLLHKSLSPFNVLAIC